MVKCSVFKISIMVTTTIHGFFDFLQIFTFCLYKVYFLFFHFLFSTQVLQEFHATSYKSKLQTFRWVLSKTVERLYQIDQNELQELKTVWKYVENNFCNLKQVNFTCFNVFHWIKEWGSDFSDPLKSRRSRHASSTQFSKIWQMYCSVFGDFFHWLYNDDDKRTSLRLEWRTDKTFRW